MARDAFQQDLEAEPTEEGPFRTPEPTEEQRYQTAREASWARVAEATALDLERKRRRAQGARAVAWVALGLTAVGAVGLLALGGLWGGSWIAGACPALSLAIVAAIVALRVSRSPRP